MFSESIQVSQIDKVMVPPNNPQSTLEYHVLALQ